MPIAFLHSPHTGNVLNPPGQSVLFINGVNTNAAETEKHAAFVSRALGGREVRFVHNKATLETCRRDHEQTMRTADFLVQHLLQEFNRHLTSGLPLNQIHVAIYAHSHGAVVTNLALQNPALAPYRSRIEVYSFGGATAISHSGIGRALNVVRTTDMTAELANSVFRQGVHNPHQMLKRVYEVMQERDVSQDEAIIVVAKQEAIDAYPHSQPGAQRLYNRRVQEYRSVARQYGYLFFPGNSYHHTHHPMGPNFFDRLAATAGSAFHHSVTEHTFQRAYGGAVTQVAGRMLELWSQDAMRVVV